MKTQALTTFLVIIKSHYHYQEWDESESSSSNDKLLIEAENMDIAKSAADDYVKEQYPKQTNTEIEFEVIAIDNLMKFTAAPVTVFKLIRG